MLDEHIYGRWKKKQYLVKWKGYPDLDNQWLDAKDMENTQELIAEFHSSNSKHSSHIKRAFKHVPYLYSPSTLPPTLISTHMSDVFTLTKLPFGNEENANPLPIPPHLTATDAPPGQLCIQNSMPATFIRTRDSNFPHPDEPTPSELNDSNQENIAPPASTVPRISPPVQAVQTPLGRMQAAVPFTDDSTTNQAIVSAITRVRNNIDHGNTYIGQIEEIVRIAHAL